MTTPDSSTSQTAWSDAAVERTLGSLLRAGVLTAAAVVLIGGISYLVQHGRTKPDDRVFHGEPAVLRSVPGVVREALTLHSRGIIQLGLLLLIATPISRVVFSVIAFGIQRDYLYVLLTVVVLAVLIFSLLGGHF